MKLLLCAMLFLATMGFGQWSSITTMAIPTCSKVGEFIHYDGHRWNCSKFRIASSYKDGYCDIRGDCWWSGHYCHGCGVNETHPFFASELLPYIADEVKRGTVIYAPPVKKPTWEIQKGSK
jgi:hypothetical protein